MNFHPNREWLARQSRHLKQNSAAVDFLAQRHISSEVIAHFGIGLSTPDLRRTYSEALCCPLRNLKQEAEDRYLYLNVPGVTKFTSDAEPMSAWSPGEARPYYGFVGKHARTLIWFCSIFDCWAVSHAAASHSKKFAEFAFACSSHGSTVIPQAMQDELTDARFPHRIIAYSMTTDEAAVAEKLAEEWPRTTRLCVPVGTAQTWSELAQNDPDHLLGALNLPGIVAPQANWRRLFPACEKPERLSVGHSYHRGRLYLAYNAHREQKQPDGSVLEGEVCLVLTSDGHVLEATEAKPIPGSTKPVLRLSDGTALDHPPIAVEGCTWSQASVFSFLEEKNENMVRPHPPLAEMLASLERHIRSSVWLPHDDNYALLALVVACSYAQELFDAVPLVGLVGNKGTGKTELAVTLAALGANGYLLRSFTEAAFVDAVNTRRGMIVIDDLEKIAPGRGAQAAKFGELQQLLKMSYKKDSAVRDRCNGSKKQESLRTYGIKIVNNTQGIDPIIADRMFEVSTKCCPDVKAWQDRVEGTALTSVEISNLRDELHTWVFRHVAEIRKEYEFLATAKSNRAAEIMMPLQVIAGLSGDSHWNECLNSVAFRRQSRAVPALPDQLISSAISSIVAAGFRHLSTLHVINEIRQELDEKPANSNDHSWLNASNIGRILRRDWTETTGAERPFVQFRHRLRSYPIRADKLDRLTATANDGSPAQLVVVQNAGAFCRDCVGCPYANGCEIAQTQQQAHATA